MNASNSKPPAYPRFKIALFVLLILNSLVYALGDTIGSALDSLAWLILLVLFELETEFARLLRARSAVATVHIARMAAMIAVVAASAAYLYEAAWLDVINSGLWFAIVVMLEFEVRFPRLVANRRKEFLAAAWCLYSGLAILVLLWASQGDWLDAYDAFLWIAAFATIEMDVLRYSERASANG